MKIKDKQKFWRVVVPVCIAVWTLVIWGQSLLPAEKSVADSYVVEQMLPESVQNVSVEPQWWTDALAGESQYLIPLAFFVRKAAHFAEFAVLGLLWAVCRRHYSLRFSWAYGIVVGVADEWLQTFAPGRGPAVYDVAIDTVGYLCGWALTVLILYLWNKKKNKACNL